MKKLAVAFTLLLLTACASTGPGRTGDSGPDLSTPAYRWSLLYGRFFVNPTSGSPKVYLVDDAYIVVDQEPILIRQGDMNAIYWTIDPGSAYWFQERDGIKFATPHPTALRCDRTTDVKIYLCTYKRSDKKKYPYTINVTRGAKDLTSDPTVMND